MMTYYTARLTRADIFDGRLAKHGVDVRVSVDQEGFVIQKGKSYLWGEEKHEGFVEFALSPSVSIKPLRIAIRKAFGTGLVEMVD